MQSWRSAFMRSWVLASSTADDDDGAGALYVRVAALP
jgi:hypothetical protein